MKSGSYALLVLLCLRPTLTTADNNPRSVLIYVEKSPPAGYTFEEWNSAIFEACEAWFLPAGCSITSIKDRSRAEITFGVRRFAQRRLLATCRTCGWRGFPRIPQDPNKSHIEIAYGIRSSATADLRRTLKHEVGHAIGLPHHPRSLVQNGAFGYKDLTSYDRAMIRRLRRHIEAAVSDGATIRRD